MPTERMEEVEVVCGWEPCGHCAYPEIPATLTTLPVAPGSLTAARLRLADAAEAWAAKWLAPAACRDQDEWDAMLESAVKLAALRTARGA